MVKLIQCDTVEDLVAFAELVHPDDLETFAELPDVVVGVIADVESLGVLPHILANHLSRLVIVIVRIPYGEDEQPSGNEYPLHIGHQPSEFIVGEVHGQQHMGVASVYGARREIDTLSEVPLLHCYPVAELLAQLCA